jgi:hypothetical protein
LNQSNVDQMLSAADLMLRVAGAHELTVAVGQNAALNSK